MASTTAFRGRSFQSPAVTNYNYLANGADGASGTETQGQITFRSAGVISNLYLNVYSNDSTGGTSVFTVRNNAANTNISISVAFGTTGIFTDLSDYAVVAVSNKIDLLSVTGTGGTFIQWEQGYDFNANTNTVIKHHLSGNTAIVTASITVFYPIGGAQGAIITANTLSNQQFRVGGASTFSDLQINIATNSDINTATLNFQKNGSNGNQAISIPASTTGILEDTVNTDAVISGDLINYALTTGASTVNLNPQIISCEETTTNNSYHNIAGSTNGITINPAATVALVLGGYYSAGSTVTARYFELFSPITINYLFNTWAANTINGISTVYFNKNNNNTTLAVSIGNSVSGQFTDSSDSISINPNDKIMYNIISGGSTGTATGYIAGSLYSLTPTQSVNYGGSVPLTSISRNYNIIGY